MNCGLFRSSLIEVARGARIEGRLAGHLDGCAECREFLVAQRRLSSAAKGLAARAAVVSLPEGLESELLAEFDAVRRVTPRPATFWMTAGTLAMAAAVMGAVVLLRMPARKAVAEPQVVARTEAPVAIPEERLSTPVPIGLRPVTVPPRPIRPAALRNPAKQDEAQEDAFVSIPYTMPLAPEERANVVRMDVPVAALIAAGLPMRVRDMSANASADVLVGEDGRARAVRLVSVADSNFTRSYR